MNPRNLHEDCYDRSEPCAAGRPESCPLEPARALRRQAKLAEWSALEVRREGPDGLRHYLDGRPVRCGALIKLQAVEDRCDADDLEYTAPLPRGEVVRYEMSQDHRRIDATLHARVAGHRFTAGLELWMRFRWPERDR